jgi:hypothetical protein
MLAIAAIAGIGCYHPPPGSPLEAAVNFRSTVFDLIGKDEAATARLNALRVGMSEQEVIAQAGSPSKRETRAGDDRRASETWTYEGELSTLAVLTFEDGKLAAVQTDPDRPTTD